jgi:hypothetical protein
MPANVTYTFALTISPTSSAKAGIYSIAFKTTAGRTVSSNVLQLTVS